MNAPREAKVRLDYKKLNSTGEKVRKEIDSIDDQLHQDIPPEGSSHHTFHELHDSLSSAFNSLSLADVDLTPKDLSIELGASDEAGSVTVVDDADIETSIQSSIVSDLKLSEFQQPEHPADLSVDIQSQDPPVDNQHHRSPTEVTMSASKQLLIEVNTIFEDINDFLEENVINEIGSNIGDHDEMCRKVEELRTSYRGKHNQLRASMDLEEYQDKYEADYNECMQSIKQYIKCLKAQRRNLRDDEDEKLKDESQAKTIKFNFFEQEIK